MPAKVALKDPKDFKLIGQKLPRVDVPAKSNGTAQFTPSVAFPGRNDRITGLMAEGDKVWMQFNLRGTHTASFYGLPATGRRVEMPEVGIMRVVDGKWTESWYFGDELGILLQLNAVNMLEG